MALLRPTAAPVLYPKLPDQPALVILLRELMDQRVKGPADVAMIPRLRRNSAAFIDRPP